MGSNDNVSQGITPIYTTPSPNETISLAREAVSLEIRGEQVTGTAQVSVRFLPAPRLVFEVEVENGSPFILIDEVGSELTFTEREIVVPTLCVRAEGKHLVLTPTCEPITALRPGAKNITHVVFHLVNFPAFTGTAAATAGEGKKQHRIDRVTLSADGWRIALSLLVTTREHVKLLKESGGFAITQVGLVERDDEQAIGQRDAEEILTALHYFLSFAKGGWAAPILPVGFDRDSVCAWEMWGSGSCDSWRYVPSWFDTHHGNLLEDTFTRLIDSASRAARASGTMNMVPVQAYGSMSMWLT